MSGPALPANENRAFLALFLVAALWNLAGAIPGVIDPAGMFAREFGRPLTDPVQVAIYRGAWGTALLYGLGFLAVARRPARHAGVVAMGGLGKALFAINLAVMHAQGWTSDFAILVIVGDGLFVVAFIVYFLRLRRHGIPCL
jgi:hypothetical protein